MAGHSKWANIQHRKGAQDAKRGKLFTKLIREITVGTPLTAPSSVAPVPRKVMTTKKFATKVMVRAALP